MINIKKSQTPTKTKKQLRNQNPITKNKSSKPKNILKINYCYNR